ncbi:CAP domain-containing protein [Piscinibacter terrae]|uniref:CAP domain-containing protein n=1 Tax=Piscinibacter terrae TaxID=2496871 RepID=UPI001F284D40|nr:CAP domain-containing protein [Albitalea terrae]
MQKRSSLAGIFVSVLACSLLGACGGGGSASAAPTPTPTPTPSPPPPAPAVATCGLSNFTSTMLARVNQWRASGATCGSTAYGPAPALAWNDLLTQAAAVHSQDMVSHNFFDHAGSNGSSPGDRITAAGYVWSSYGENIAAGQSSINNVVDGWIASPGHCANIMNPAFVHLGVACINGTASDTYSTYWTMDLGKPF